MRHWTFWEWVAYAALFVSAMIVAAYTGARITPDLSAYMPQFIHSSIWGFAPLILIVIATIILVLRELIFPFRNNSNIFAETSQLSLLCYGDHRLPTRLSTIAVWRWYCLRQIAIMQDKDGVLQQGVMSTTLFVNFEVPVKVGTLEVVSTNILKYEIKEFNNRFAIIVFSGELPAGTLTIRTS